MKTKDWAIFFGLGLIWGTSFLWIKIAVADVSPLVLVGLRTLIASLGLGAIIFFKRKNMPAWGDIKKKIPVFIVLALTNISIPWALISWGEKYVDSGIASILNSATPFFTIIIAPLMLNDERITLPKVAGLITGFVGVVMLMLPNIHGGWTDNLLGQAACLLAAIFYGFAAVYGRKKSAGLPPELQSFMQLSFGSTFIWLAAFSTEGLPTLPTKAITWVALLWLGLLCSCIAYILYFYLLHKVGPTSVSMVTYIPPLIAVLLGITFLGETFYWQSILGALLILSGIFLINTRREAVKPGSAE